MRPRLGVAQAAMYSAEKVLHLQGRAWARLSDVQVYVDSLIDTDWFFENFPEVMTVSLSRCRSRWSLAGALCEGGGDIFIGAGGMTQPVILHELAHLCTPETVGHGPQFAQVYLKLVRHEMGFLAYSDLLNALKATEPFAELKVSA